MKNSNVRAYGENVDENILKPKMKSEPDTHMQNTKRVR